MPWQKGDCSGPLFYLSFSFGFYITIAELLLTISNFFFSYNFFPSPQAQSSEDEEADEDEDDGESLLTKKLNDERMMLSDEARERQELDSFNELIRTNQEKQRSQAQASQPDSAAAAAAATNTSASDGASAAQPPAPGAAYRDKELIITRIVDGREQTVLVSDPAVIDAYMRHAKSAAKKPERRVGRQPALADSDDDEAFLGDDDSVWKPSRAATADTSGSAGTASVKGKRGRMARGSAARKSRGRGYDGGDDEGDEGEEPVLSEDDEPKRSRDKHGKRAKRERGRMTEAEQDAMFEARLRGEDVEDMDDEAQYLADSEFFFLWDWPQREKRRLHFCPN